MSRLTLCTMVFNRHDLLRELFVSLAHSTRRPDEVVVVDHAYDTSKILAINDALDSIPLTTCARRRRHMSQTDQTPETPEGVRAQELAREFMDDGSPSGPDEWRTVSMREVEMFARKVLREAAALLRPAPKKQFPIQRERDAKPHPLAIPWSVAEKAYSVYSAQYGRSQTLERMAERGGFYPSEMDGLVPGWRDECSEIAALKSEVERLRAALPLPAGEIQLGHDSPWPLREVLLRLADAADHLLSHHDCDTHGWEGIGVARDRARAFVAKMSEQREGSLFQETLTIPRKPKEKL